MKKKESVLSKDLHLIRVAGEENNANARKALAPKYRRIRQEKASKLWIWFYYWMDRLARRKIRKMRQEMKRNRDRYNSLEEEVKRMEKNGQYISNGKIVK